MKKCFIATLAAFLVLAPVAISAQTLGPTPGTPSNLNAAADPTVNNDSTQAYQIGSLWQNANTGRIFIARSVAVGAAVWTLLELSDHPGYIANNWYLPLGGSPGTSTCGAVAINAIKIYPRFIKERITISNLGVRVITGTTGNVQLAIYKNNPATMRPTGNPLVSTASMVITAPGTLSSAASVQLEPGMYWFAGNTDTVSNTFSCDITTTYSWNNMAIGSSTQANVLGAGSGGLTGLTVTQTFGTWPDLTSGSFAENVGTNAFIGVEFQVSSIP